jgi:uncharacterized protein
LNISPSELSVAVQTGAVTTALVYPADRTSPATFILAHGAGANQRSPFMVSYSQAIAALGVDVVTFNFLYTEQRRRLPDRTPLLEACYRAVIDTVRGRVESARRLLVVGGKSMGGRVASQIAAADRDLLIGGVVLLGYPLHPPGRASDRRDRHLGCVRRPMLFVQGSRDAFGSPDELAEALEALQPQPVLHVVRGADHSFKLKGRDVNAQAAIDDDVQRTVAEWIEEISRRSAP